MESSGALSTVPDSFCPGQVKSLDRAGSVHRMYIKRELSVYEVIGLGSKKSQVMSRFQFAPPMVRDVKQKYVIEKQA